MKQKQTQWIFFSALPPFRGGISKFSAKTLSVLTKIQEVKAFTFKKQYPNWLFPGTSQFDYSASNAPNNGIVSTFNPLSYVTSALRLRREKPAVFITTYWMTFMAPMMVFWTWFLPKRTKKIAIIHNLIPHEQRFFDRWFNKMFLNAYDGFVVLSDAVKQQVLTLKPKARISVLPHPPYQLDNQELTKEEACLELGLDATKKTLLFFGLIRPYKGLESLIDAFALLEDDYQLIIAGEVYGNHQVYWDKLNQLPFNNWRFDQSFIAEDKVALYFKACDLVVLPYQSATQSGVRALALSQKRALLCTNVGGLAENLESNAQGFVLVDTEKTHFCERIKSLFETGEIHKCNTQLLSKELDLEGAWNQFAEGLIKLAEQA